VFYWMVKFTLRPIFRTFFRPVVQGQENIPSTGGGLLASNHLSMCDSLFLPVLSRRRMTFLAKKEYFTGRGLKGRSKAAFVRWTGLIPLDRGDGNASAAALATGCQAINDEKLLVIYPEGTRSPDGRLYRGKTGLARVAMETGAPVIPVAMIGTDRVLPVGKVLPRLAQVGIRIGPPLQPPAPSNDPTVQQSQAREFTDAIMSAIADLSNQKRAHVDAAVYKSQRAAG
jgi:1-acyl-sn-glycerol-3-phosphate acyltransferase